MFTLNRAPLDVSEHAIIRYLERAMNLNIDAMRQHIRATCEAGHALGAVSVRAEGLRFEIAGNRVVTVVPDSAGPSRTTRAKAQAKIERASA